MRNHFLVTLNYQVYLADAKRANLNINPLTVAVELAKTVYVPSKLAWTDCSVKSCRFALTAVALGALRKSVLSEIWARLMGESVAA